jgi:hypothetical protein
MRTPIISRVSADGATPSLTPTPCFWPFGSREDSIRRLQRVGLRPISWNGVSRDLSGSGMKSAGLVRGRGPKFETGRGGRRQACR